MQKKMFYISLFVIAISAGIYFFPGFQEKLIVDEILDKNLIARGGSDAWAQVHSLQQNGTMSIGPDTSVPFVLQQKQPKYMCISFVFNNEESKQCSNGKSGWKLLPYQGRKNTQSLSSQELQEAADAGNIYGLLDKNSGNQIEFTGVDKIDGEEVDVLKVTLPMGAVRWIFVSKRTGLEKRMKMKRIVRGKERWATTDYADWYEEDGLLISHKQSSTTEGEKNINTMIIESVDVNPQLDDALFSQPISNANQVGK